MEQLWKEKEQISKQYQELQKERSELFEEKEKRRKLEYKNHDLTAFLNSLNLSQFFAKFHSENIEIETLQDLTDQELQGLGLNLGQRKKLISSIKKGTSKGVNLFAFYLFLHCYFCCCSEIVFK